MGRGREGQGREGEGGRREGGKEREGGGRGREREGSNARIEKERERNGEKERGRERGVDRKKEGKGGERTSVLQGNKAQCNSCCDQWLDTYMNAPYALPIATPPTYLMQMDTDNQTPFGHLSKALIL